jgi:hypothetical protein
MSQKKTATKNTATTKPIPPIEPKVYFSDIEIEITPDEIFWQSNINFGNFKKFGYATTVSISFECDNVPDEPTGLEDLVNGVRKASYDFETTGDNVEVMIDTFGNYNFQCGENGLIVRVSNKLGKQLFKEMQDKILAKISASMNRESEDISNDEISNDDVSDSLSE